MTYCVINVETRQRMTIAAFQALMLPVLPPQKLR